VPDLCGKDRFRFDHSKRGRGSYFCSQHGSGDGFRLLELFHGWAFAEARQRVIEAGGLENIADKPRRAANLAAPQPEHVPPLAHPTDRVHRLRWDRCAIANCDDAVAYLESRGLWPLPEGCTLSAHATVEYFDDGRHVGRYPALVADVVDRAGELVTIHVTYLQAGRKLASHEPRKLLSAVTGRIGCAVRLMPAADVLGIAEGIETALSAAAIDGLPVWAALNASLLARFEPPPSVALLRIYSDRDEAGLMAALCLLERLQGRMRLEVQIPSPPAKDWNDVLLHRGSKRG
jgi:putative DNA primase/helicase